MVARGDVILFVHQDDSRIESQEIHYDPSTDRIWSDSATTRTDERGAVTRGTAFESDLDFADVRILNVRGGGGRVF
jgi:lipopolysaccharide assembly outer membrane protein LptD (OstA)